MSDKTFVDTNILVYAHDRDAGEKCEASRSLLRELWEERCGGVDDGGPGYGAVIEGVRVRNPFVQETGGR